MNRTGESSLVVTMGLGGLLALVTAYLYTSSGMLFFAALMPGYLLMISVSLLALVRIRLERVAAEEERNRAAEVKAASSGLFGSSGDLPVTSRRTQRIIETFLVPAATPVLALILSLWAWRLHDGLPWSITAPENALIAASFLAGQAFLLFLLYRFMLGMSRNAGDRLLRGPALYTGLLSIASVLGAAAAVAVHGGYIPADTLAGRIMTGVWALLALELVWRTLVMIYSPRRRTFASTAYESRILRSVLSPKGWTTSIAQSVDYQFGFGLSGSWFSGFLRSALIPLLVFQIALFYAMTAMTVIQPHEVGIKERFGRMADADPILASGFHWKLPWPFETVRRVPANDILGGAVGFEDEDETRREVLLWTIPHYRNEDLFITASRSADVRSAGAVPVNLLAINLIYEYRITNAAAYAYGFSDPETLIRQVAYRSMTAEAAVHDLSDLLGGRREQVGNDIRGRMQSRADEAELGVEILFAGIQGIHPPVQVADAFQSVVGSLEEREASILLARAYTNSTLPEARAEADAAEIAAAAYRDRRTTQAEAENDHFTNRLKAYRTQPEVFRSRLYLETLSDALAGSRLFIVDAPAGTDEILYFNFEEDPFTSVLDMGPLSEGDH